MATQATRVPPPPPRATGEPEVDMRGLMQWAYDFYEKGVTGGYFLNDLEESQSGDFDPSTLPDPATSTIARAQQTANEAYTLAAQARQIALAAQGVFGTITVSDANATADVTFSSAVSNTNYIVTFTPVISKTGSPASGAFQITELAKTTTKFTITLAAAPGAGTSVTYQYRIQAAPA
jgi:hypothetical protein